LWPTIEDGKFEFEVTVTNNRAFRGGNSMGVAVDLFSTWLDVALRFPSSSFCSYGQ